MCNNVIHRRQGPPAAEAVTEGLLTLVNKTATESDRTIDFLYNQWKNWAMKGGPLAACAACGPPLKGVDTMKFRKTKPGYGYLLGLVGLCLGVAGSASLVTLPAVAGWYQDLVHPSFTPPDSVFGPVWTTLYLAMAVAAWRAWRCDDFQWGSPCLGLFLLQLTLNFAWSFLFFQFHLIGVAAIEIVVLELAIIVTTLAFSFRDRAAGILMLPYIVWVGFATVLNFGFWSLN